ncbi:MAG: hypothetical protein ACYC35_13850 [Pirellulales bacterium]
MHKLVTIALFARGDGRPPHGTVEEHLVELLQNGWQVVSMKGVGAGGGEGFSFAGWLAVVLERNKE